ncbi:MAG TPA: phasin family protein [Casimicrobiaceae bacterium]|jgi:poly(hydroxyalkanoate) granule-associated protein
MLKKARAELGAKSAAQAQGLSKSVLASSHQIWLAGLGAFSKAQEGGARVFETLVKQGEMLEAKTRKAAAQTADVARDAAMSKAKEVQAMAGGTWDKLEQVFEDRVSRALSKLGVHTSSDVERLSARVNELSEAVNALLNAQGIRRKPAPSPARPKATKSAAKDRRAGPKAAAGETAVTSTTKTAARTGTRRPKATAK